MLVCRLSIILEKDVTEDDIKNVAHTVKGMPGVAGVESQMYTWEVIKAVFSRKPLPLGMQRWELIKSAFSS